MSAPAAVPEVGETPMWPSGDSRPVGTLRLSPQEITARFHLCFSIEADDLDEFLYTVATTPDGHRFCLLRYRRSPSAGTDVLIDSAVSRTEGLADVQAALGLGPESFEWITDVECQFEAAS